MEGAVGVEPTFPVPVTDSGLEDRLDYAPRAGAWEFHSWLLALELEMRFRLITFTQTVWS